MRGVSVISDPSHSCSSAASSLAFSCIRAACRQRPFTLGLELSHARHKMSHSAMHFEAAASSTWHQVDSSVKLSIFMKKRCQAQATKWAAVRHRYVA